MGDPGEGPQEGGRGAGAVWFEGEQVVDCTLAAVRAALDHLGEHYVDLVGRLPGMTDVELLEEGPGFVTLRTNEGLMKRTNIVRRDEPEAVVVELDEEYRAGSRVTVRSHFADEFTEEGGRVRHRLVISGLETGGFLGFLYQRFGSSRIGGAFLASYAETLRREA